MQDSIETATQRPVKLLLKKVLKLKINNNMESA